MNKQILILSIVLIASCLKSQSWEEGICNCIENNYNLNQWNYFDEINAFEEEMIERGKFTNSTESKLELLNKLNSDKHVDFYKFQFSERLLTFGEESIEYCIRRELFNKDCSEKHWSENLVRELRLNKYTLRKDRDFKQYNINQAHSISDAINSNTGDDKLKRLFVLQELYRRIPDETWYKLDQLDLKILKDKEERKNIKIPIDAVKLHITEESKLTINNIEYAINQLCEILLEPIQNGKLIHFTSSINAKYKFYKSAYDKTKECIKGHKDSLSQELFNKNYNQLNPENKKTVDESIKTSIIEGE